LLESRGVGFAELELLKDYPHRATYPQVFINGEHIGGADELEAWFSEAAVA
jgi:glutaredoxin